MAVQTAVACMKQFVCPHAVGARAMGYACVCGGVSEHCMFRVFSVRSGTCSEVSLPLPVSCVLPVSCFVCRLPTRCRVELILIQTLC